MDETDRRLQELVRRRAAYRRLGTSNPVCICGETDPDCFEADHVFRRFDGTTFRLCKNCHAKKTAREQAESPPPYQFEDDPFERMGHALDGIRQYHRLIAEHLERMAQTMFKLAGKGINFED